MGMRALGALFLLAAMWGGSFLLIRVASPALGPAVLVDVRVFLAALALVPLALVRRQRVALLGRWRDWLLLGAVNAALPFTLIALAELHLPASLAAILNATTPLFAALIAAATLGEPLTGGRVAGLLLGVAGVAALLGWSPIGLSPLTLLSVAASLLAALSYAVGGVLAKRRWAGTTPLALAIGQQIAAGVVLLPLALARLPRHAPSPGVALAVVGLALFATSLGYLLYFFLMAEVGPTRTLSVTFLVPVFGVLWSALFLRESIGPGTILGLGIILLSVTLVTGAFSGRSLLQRRTAVQVLPDESG